MNYAYFDTQEDMLEAVEQFQQQGYTTLVSRTATQYTVAYYVKPMMLKQQAT